MSNEIRELSMDELAHVSAAAMDGISYLIAVTQMKASNANDNALAGAAPKGHVHKIGWLTSGIASAWSV